MANTGIEVDATDLMKQLSKLPDRIAKRVSKKAVSFGATPIVRETRKAAPKRTGLTKKAIGKKAIAYPRGHSAVAIIGVRKKFHGKNPDGSDHWPFNIAHILDRGHIMKDGTWVKGSMFIEKGAEAARGQAIDRMTAKLAEGIEQEAAKL